MGKEPSTGQPKRGFNGLTTKEWISSSRSVWNDPVPPRSEKKVDHGATFPESLATKIIKMYSKQGDLVLDPFVGTGTTLAACRMTGRDGIGFEINEKYASYARDTEEQQTLVPWGRVKVYQDDCRNVLNHVKEGSVQLVLTSPPYANFILKSCDDRKNDHKKSVLVTKNNSATKPYSDGDQRDFGILKYDEFLEEIGKLMGSLYSVTKKGGYHAWIVKDGRNVREGNPYIPLHSDIAKAGQGAGLQYHDLIVVDQNENRTLVLNGYPSVFYTNLNSSFIVVMRKK